MNAPVEGESGRAQVRWTNCGRNAVILTIAPLLPAIVVWILRPLVLDPVFGCVDNSLAILCPGHPLVSWIASASLLPILAVPFTFAASVILYFVCRRKRRRLFGV